MNYKTNIEKINAQIQHYDKNKPVKLSYIWPILFNNSDQLPYLVKQFWLKEFNDLGFLTTQQILDQINQTITNATKDYDYERIEILVQQAQKIQTQTEQNQQTKYGLLYDQQTLNQSKPAYVTNEIFMQTITNLL